MTSPPPDDAPVRHAPVPPIQPTNKRATPHGEVGSSSTPEPAALRESLPITVLGSPRAARMLRDPSGLPTENRTLSNAREWERPEHGQPHRDLSLMSLREVIVELACVEDALRVHRSLSDGPQDPTKGIQLRHLRARQRVILHDLKRRARRRARLRPGTNKPTAPWPDSALGTG